MKEGKKVFVLDNATADSSSKVAAGIFNPITGKKLIKSWRVDELFPLVHRFYSELEKELGASFFFPTEIVKPIQNIEEQNFFLSKTGNPDWNAYVDVFFPETEYLDYLNTEAGGARFKNGGWVDSKAFLEAMLGYLEKNEAYQQTEFDFKNLKVFDKSVTYHGIVAKKMIFCDGYHVLKNPFFCKLPFRTTKGEQLIIEADLPDTKIINKGVFILPKGNGQFLVGATFDLTDVNNITEKGKRQLLDKLDKLLKVPYKVIHQFSGIRPTVVDRKPIIGSHPKYTNLFTFNGMGTKGISLAPYFAKQFIEHLTTGKDLEKVVDIQRFYDLFE